MESRTLWRVGEGEGGGDGCDEGKDLEGFVLCDFEPGWPIGWS